MMASTRSRNVANADEPRPRIHSAPAYRQSAGQEAIDLAELAGVRLDRWQKNFVIDALAEDDRGQWAAMECGLVVARQNGKNEALLVRELAGLFLLEERDMIHSAQQQDTSVEQYHKLRALIEGTPELSRRVAKMPAGKGTEGIYLKRDPKTGRAPRLMFRTRTGAGGLGFSIDFLGFDEAFILPSTFHGLLMPVLSARPNVQIWYTSSAVDQQRDEHGVVLAKLRARAMAGDDPDLVYAEFSADIECLDELTREMAEDPRLAREANPTYGVRISADYVDRELRALDLRSFGNMRLGIGDWPDTSEEGERVITNDMWIPLADPGSRIFRGHAFALDVDPHQAWATISAAGEREDGVFHVGVVAHERGIGWIVDEAKRLTVEHEAPLIIDPRVDLGTLMLALEEADVMPVRMTTNDYKDACGGFFQAVVEKRLRYAPPQPELDAAIAGAKTKTLYDAWKWDRRSGALITPLVACTNALWGAQTQRAPGAWNLNEVAEQMFHEGKLPTLEPAPARDGFIPIC